MKAKLSQRDRSEQYQMLAELRTVQAQLAEVLDLTKDSRANLIEGLEMVRLTVINVNQRTCPTLFIILPLAPDEVKSDSLEDTLTAFESAVERAKRIYSFVTDSSVQQEVLAGLLKETEHLSLICELCHQTQFPAYELTKPREVVGKVFPLAKVGLKVACLVNTASSLGRVFGLPTPVLSSEMMAKAKVFVESARSSSLDDFELLQERARGDNGGGDSGPANEKDMSEGYCAREFRRFLKEVDPKDEWCGLSAKVTKDGYVFFACRKCCNEK
jgi:hypothetical protein